MKLEFDNIFASEGVRPGETQDQSLVDHLSARAAEITQRTLAPFRTFPGNLLRDHEGLRAGNSDHRNPGTARR